MSVSDTKESVHTFTAQQRIVGDVIFYALRAESKESRLLVPYQNVLS
jgi:hypothetical protein